MNDAGHWYDSRQRVIARSNDRLAPIVVVLAESLGWPWVGVEEIDLKMSAKLLKRMVGTIGFEPTTSSVSRKRSNQLSYAPAAPL